MRTGKGQGGGGQSSSWYLNTNDDDDDDDDDGKHDQQSITAEATATTAATSHTTKEEVHNRVRDLDRDRERDNNLHHHVRHTSNQLTVLEQNMPFRFDQVHAKLDDIRCDLIQVRTTSTVVQAVHATVRDLQRSEILNHLRPDPGPGPGPGHGGGVDDPDIALARYRALVKRASSPWRWRDGGNGNRNPGTAAAVDVIRRRLAGWVENQPGMMSPIYCYMLRRERGGMRGSWQWRWWRFCGKGMSRR